MGKYSGSFSFFSLSLSLSFLFLVQVDDEFAGERFFNYLFKASNMNIVWLKLVEFGGWFKVS